MLVPSEDTFWSVYEREQEEERQIRERIAAIRGQLEVVLRSRSMRVSPGFGDFLKSIESMRANAMSSLVGESRLTNEGLREQRGRVKALDDILALLRDDDSTTAIEAELRSSEDALTEALRRRPNPREATR